MLRGAVYSVSAFFARDLLNSLRSRRFLTASITLGVILLVSVWFLATVAGTGPEGGGGLIWQRGSNGTLTTLAFAVIPLALPLLPVALVATNLRRDLSRNDPDLAISRPAPGAGMALGKSAAMYVAVAVPVVLLSLATVLIFQTVTNTTIDGLFLAGFVASNLILAALYLLLALPTGTVLGPRNLSAIMFLVWLGFNILSPTAFFLLGELIGFRQITGPQSFEPIWTDTLSFTGIYHGFLAPYVPEELGYVILPGSIILLLRWGPLVWVILLLVIYSFVSGRVPK